MKISAIIQSALNLKIPYIEEAKYRKRAIKLQNTDPHNLDFLEKRLERLKTDKKNFNNQFVNLLHASETLLFEKVYKPEFDKSKIQKFIDKLCLHYEEFNNQRDFSMKIAFTTTNSKYAVRNLITSAINELEKSKFNYKSNTAIIEFLVVENSTDEGILRKNSEFCRNFKNPKINIIYVGWQEKTETQGIQNPYQIAQSRTFLINKINSLQWIASKNSPIWILDDDFEFTTTIPAENNNIENTRLGSIFHRLECVANENNFDAIVGGNSGSPPIPELSTISLQLKDLKHCLLPDFKHENRRKLLDRIQQNTDYYYDLSRIDIDYFAVTQEITKNKLEFIDEYLYKLLTGVPASRYLFANYTSNEEYNSAWNLDNNTAVSGGNTIYFNSKLLNSKTYWAIEYKNIKSRRADAIWFLLNLQKGFKIQKVNFPLTHARTKRVSTECDIENLTINALKDVFGVALWEVVKENQYSELKNIDISSLHYRIKKRKERFDKNMITIANLLREIAIIYPKINELQSYKTLLNLSEYRIKIEYEQINLIEYGSKL